ncbi:hypothetical protein QYM36_002683 [Artemia franciscana]|uniref:Phosphagen kinase N-terminal domain-containing protein n=1 Tax=Artemia franciscana TaxID=6661 RepID=A0AA88LHT7_ARTSF|nr:hypothetical protein QYM36_002683 [Artemia franciscana]
MSKTLTSSRATLLNVISPDAGNLGFGADVNVSATESYSLFVPLYTSVIEEYHIGFTKKTPSPPSEFGKVNTPGDLDPDNEFLISTRLEYGRCLQGLLHNILPLLQKKFKTKGFRNTATKTETSA